MVGIESVLEGSLDLVMRVAVKNDLATCVAVGRMNDTGQSAWLFLGHVRDDVAEEFGLGLECEHVHDFPCRLIERYRVAYILQQKYIIVK